MRCAVVAVGTELLLGQVVDTNSAWIGEQLAVAGVDSHYQVKVGDNQARIVAALADALRRSDAVIVCGGLGPTPDDITREALAEAMGGVALQRDESLVEAIRAKFGSRGRVMSDNNLKQADVPDGACVIPQTRGTAPGLICPVGDKVVYAVPGVPSEMSEMVGRAVIPDLQRRSGTVATIRSRTLRTWGLAESAVAEVVAPRIAALDGPGNPTIAFLASGMEGIKVRITTKGSDPDAVAARLDAEEVELRVLLGQAVFGVDDETMEMAVAGQLSRAGLSLGLAESLTGGLVGARMASVVGASDWFRGSIVAYDRAVKHRLLGVPDGPLVSRQAAEAMATGAARTLGADIGLAVTGVAGPAEQDGQPVGTVWIGLALPAGVSASLVRLPGDRNVVRQLATISALDLLRRRLDP